MVWHFCRGRIEKAGSVQVLEIFGNQTNNDLRHNRLGDFTFNLTDKTVTARESTKPSLYQVRLMPWLYPFFILK